MPGVSPLPGVLGQPGTTVLFGGSLDNDEVRSGGRFTAGVWLDNCRTSGLEASYFFLGCHSQRFDTASGSAQASTLLARPFFDVIAGVQNAELIAFPGIATGQFRLSSSSCLQGAEVNMLCIPCCTPCCNTCPDQTSGSGELANRNTPCNAGCGFNYSVSLLAGFRYVQLDETLGITESSLVNPALPVGAPECHEVKLQGVAPAIACGVRRAAESCKGTSSPAASGSAAPRVSVVLDSRSSSAAASLAARTIAIATHPRS